MTPFDRIGPSQEFLAALLAMLSDGANAVHRHASTPADEVEFVIPDQEACLPHPVPVPARSGAEMLLPFRVIAKGGRADQVQRSAEITGPLSGSRSDCSPACKVYGYRQFLWADGFGMRPTCVANAARRDEVTGSVVASVSVQMVCDERSIPVVALRPLNGFSAPMTSVRPRPDAVIECLSMQDNQTTCGSCQGMVGSIHHSISSHRVSIPPMSYGNAFRYGNTGRLCAEHLGLDTK